MSDERQASDRARMLVEMFGQLLSRERSGRAELLAYIAALEADRARLDWLERTGGYVTRYNSPFEGWPTHWETNSIDANGEHYGATARDAIDAAMSSSPLAPTQEGA